MRTATYTYDAVGNRTAVVDYSGHATYFQYDALNRLTSEIDPLAFFDYNWGAARFDGRRFGTANRIASTSIPGNVEHAIHVMSYGPMTNYVPPLYKDMGTPHISFHTGKVWDFDRQMHAEGRSDRQILGAMWATFGRGGLANTTGAGTPRAHLSGVMKDIHLHGVDHIDVGGDFALGMRFYVLYLK